MIATEQSLGGVKAASSIIGDKWTPQIMCIFVSETSVGFCQLQDLVNGINPRTLSLRLVSLEAAGIIEKQTLGASSRTRYHLTDKGRDLLPILQAMAVWGEKHSAPVA